MAVHSLAASLAKSMGGLVPVTRCSTRDQAGPRQVNLVERSEAFRLELKAAAPQRRILHMPLYGIEKGKLSNARPTLLAAAEYAASKNAILVAPDLSRFIRSETYHRCKNRDAIPTFAEIEGLHELTGGVVLATLAHPDMSESERHSHATKRTGRAGRPSRGVAQMEKIFMLLGRKTGKGYERPLRAVAARCGCSKDSISRLLSKKIDGFNFTWGDTECPIHFYRTVWGEGVSNPLNAQFSGRLETN